MLHRVQAKQPNSKMCLVCGLRNESGLRASFFEVEGEQVVCQFKAGSVHQGYPERLHGGIATAVLDETIGRAIRIRQRDEIWGVTIEVTSRFRRPIPLDRHLRVVGQITRETRRHFEGTGRLLLPDNSVAVEGSGRYLKLPIDQIADFDFEHQDWMVVPLTDDPVEFDL